MKRKREEEYKKEMDKSVKSIKTIKYNYVYIIWLREFMRLDENVYKIGKTSQIPNSRLQGYPKGSKVIIFAEVDNCHSMENYLIAEFDNRYECKREYGREYYAGDVRQMKSTFLRLVQEAEEAEIRRGFLSKAFRFVFSKLY